MTAPPSSPRSPLRRMLAGLIAATTAIAASVLGVALPAQALGTASISGTVTSSLGGTPIEGVRVQAFSHDGFGGFGVGPVAFTEADGTFVITELVAGEYTLQFQDDTLAHLSTLLGSAPAFNTAQLVTVADGQALVDIDQVLQRAGTIAGTVTDSLTGAPIEGVEVRGQYFTDVAGYTGSDVTGPDGTYELVGLLPGDDWEIVFDGTAISYILEFYDDARFSFAATPVSVVAGQQTAGIDASLDQSGTITGTVELAANPGVGVDGAEIEFVDAEGNQSFTNTDATGAFTMTGLRPSEYRVRASIDGTVPEWWDGRFDGAAADLITVAPGAVVDGIDFALDAGGTITGIITGPSGEPLEGILVEAFADGQSDRLFTSTNELGEYTLTGVGPLSYYVIVTPPETLNLRAQFYPGVDTFSEAESFLGLLDGEVSGISVQLPVGAEVAGTVTDAVTAQPLPDIEVTLRSNSLDLWRYATTGPDGDWILRGLPEADDWVVEFNDWTDTYLREYYDDVIRFSEAERLSLVSGLLRGGVDAGLTAAASVSGRVVDDTGAGVPFGEVWVAPNGSLDDAEVVITDSDGYFDVNGLRPGDYRMMVGTIFTASQTLRSEWFDSVYDPAQSTEFALEPGDELSGVEIELLPLDEPDYVETPTITVDDSDPADVRLEIGLPTSGPTPYGVSTRINYGFDGESFTVGPFDDGTWGFGSDGQGYDAHALVGARAFGSDGIGAEVRTLVEVGDGPGYRVQPNVVVGETDGSSAELSWSIPTGGEGAETWFWELYSVGEPGEPTIQSGFAFSDSLYSHSELIGGLEPSTQYELFVIGLSAEGNATYWGRADVPTTDGPPVPGLTAAPTPTITGGPRLGGELTAVIGTWAPAPLELAVQWLRNGVPIPGATDVTYVPQNDDLGARLSVRVTGSKPGFQTSVRTSLETRPVIDLGEATAQRLSGADRYATAAAISAEYPSGTPVVYLATGRGFPDALSAASAAASLGGPLLITEPGGIPTVIADELVRLDPDRVVLVGGTAVLPTGIELAVEQLLPTADVDRVQGADRYATSRAIARDAFPAGATPVAYVATGRNFPDALAASAAAGADGAPVILVDGAAGGLDAATLSLLDDLQVERVYIAGGTAVVSTGVENALRTALGATRVTRLAGEDRYLTAVAINNARFRTEPTVYLATGRDFPDALAGAALAGRNGAPLYVVPGTCVPRAVLDGMARHGATQFVKFGGPGVLTAGVERLEPC